ncbi:MAG: glycoside hydrolase family 9 protein [Planctomycetaceae bacterium]|nr:glycoside hydrolase family 9 protein [Planctomycetaceae bacterium]
MRMDRCCFLIILSILTSGVFAQGTALPIHLNSIGYLPDMPKAATVTSACADFAVRSAADHKTVFSGKVTGPVHQDDLNLDAWTADFSAFTSPGTYYLEVPGLGRSCNFKIDKAVYNDAFHAVMRGFYLWRCGTAVEGTHNGIRCAHAACHLDDAYQDYIGQPNVQRDGVGGWHDAGDFGKYTVNAGVTMGVLFMAWDQYQAKLKTLKLDLPDTEPGLPDFLNELKWEIDWLLKMQYPDGSGRVCHKLTRQHFSAFIMPETDHEKRFFTDWGSAATADFTAIMAMAARYFEPYDSTYAKTCLDAALNSYKFLKENPDNKRPDLKDFTTGGYGTSDPDDRLWAAAEVWQTTGDLNALNDFETHARDRRRLIEADWDWGSVANLGMFTYVTSTRPGRDPNLVNDIRRALLDMADTLVAQARADIFARPMGRRYYWGCNGTVARQAVILLTAHKLQPKPEYLNTALDAVSHLFGRNYYGRSFVTGLGHLPPMHPHDRRSGADGIDAPWPGYLVGGGTTATNWQDIQDDYRTNEICINWQSALVYALAPFLSR